MFATFNTVHSELLGIGAVVLLISAAVIWRERHRLDVYLLGRNQAINLGINTRAIPYGCCCGLPRWLRLQPPLSAR